MNGFSISRYGLDSEGPETFETTGTICGPKRNVVQLWMLGCHSNISYARTVAIGGACLLYWSKSVVGKYNEWVLSKFRRLNEKKRNVEQNHLAILIFVRVSGAFLTIDGLYYLFHMIGRARR
jgi:hypothetical protein